MPNHRSIRLPFRSQPLNLTLQLRNPFVFARNQGSGDISPLDHAVRKQCVLVADSFDGG